MYQEVLDMYLKQSFNKKTGRTHLSFVQGYRKDGKVKHNTVENLGYLDDWINLYDDPIAHFKAIAKERTESGEIQKKIEIDLTQKLPDNCNMRKNLGYAIPKAVYSMLHLREFFQKKQRNLNIEYNLNSVFSLLLFNRFLFPSSKRHAYETRDIFFDKFDFSLDDTYAALDYFNKYSQEIQQHLYDKVNTLIERDNHYGYYDVTNYYFEIPYEDDDIYDDNGNLKKKGSRKRGPSKEHRKDPIVQMGLLMDSNGIPMAFHTFPGNESEKQSLLPTVKRAKRDYDLERIIVVADRGLNTSDNIAFLAGENNEASKNNDGYVYGQSVLGGSAEFKAWVLDQNGYVTSKEKDKDGMDINFTHKSRLTAKTITLKNSKGNRSLTMNTYQKQMVYYSEKYAKKQKRDRERTVAKAKKLIKNPARYTKATAYGAAAYVKNIKFSKDTGEILTGQELLIDEEKIKEEEKYDGYYSIVTSEINKTDKEIRDIYKGLWEIEESFKIIKSEFSGRPVYVRKDEHIHAHFLICFVALVIMRVLEKMINEKHTVKEIRNSLISYSCSYLEQNYYMFDYRDDALRCMEEQFGLDLSKKYMTVSEIKKILEYQK